MVPRVDDVTRRSALGQKKERESSYLVLLPTVLRSWLATATLACMTAARHCYSVCNTDRYHHEGGYDLGQTCQIFFLTAQHDSFD